MFERILVFEFYRNFSASNKQRKFDDVSFQAVNYAIEPPKDSIDNTL